MHAKALTIPAARFRLLFLAALLFPAAWPAAAPAAPEEKKMERLPVYVGTYTREGSQGIYRFELDPATGAATPAELVAETENPSFLALHPNGRFLYAVNEIGNFQGTNSGSVSAFAVDPATGGLTFLNRQSSRGGAPCHLVVDRNGGNVLVANYSGGSVAVLPVEGDGRLREASDFVQHRGSSVNPRRQEGPHAHSINLDAANRRAFAADLGLDRILIYRYDPGKGTLAPNDPPAAAVDPGSGPRHFAFHPDGRRAYVINEMASTITVFDHDPERGTLAPVQTVSTLPADYSGGNTSTAEIRVHPSGKFVYGSNRGHDSIAVFAVDPQTGRLEPRGHQPTGGKNPRNFGIDPSGRFLLAANQGSGNIVVFRIDPQTGALSPTGHTVAVPLPVCVKFAGARSAE